MNEKDNDATLNENSGASVPYVAYESLIALMDAEKESMRKHYTQIIISVCAVLLAFIIGCFGTVIYILHSYEFVDFSQDVEYGDANYVGGNGDINNGEANNPEGTSQKS